MINTSNQLFYNNFNGDICPYPAFYQHMKRLFGDYKKEEQKIKQIKIIDYLPRYDYLPNSSLEHTYEQPLPTINLTELQKLYNKFVDAFNTSSEIVSSTVNAINGINYPPVIISKFDHLELKNLIVYPIKEVLELINVIGTQVEIMMTKILEFVEISKILDFDSIEKINNEIYNKLQQDELLEGGGKVKESHTKVQEIKKKLEALTGYFGEYMIKNNTQFNEFDEAIKMYNKLKTKLETMDNEMILKYFKEDISKINSMDKLVTYANTKITDQSASNILSMKTTDDKLDFKKLSDIMDKQVAIYSDLIKKLKTKTDSVMKKKFDLNAVIKLNDIVYDISDFEFIDKDESADVQKKITGHNLKIQKDTAKLELLKEIQKIVNTEQVQIYKTLIGSYTSLVTYNQKTNTMALTNPQKLTFDYLTSPDLEKHINENATNNRDLESLTGLMESQINTKLSTILPESSPLKMYVYPIYIKINKILNAESISINGLEEILRDIKDARTYLDAYNRNILLKGKGRRIEVDGLYFATIAKHINGYITSTSPLLLFLESLNTFKSSDIYRKMSQLKTNYSETFSSDTLEKELVNKIKNTSNEITTNKVQLELLENTKKQHEITPEISTKVYSGLANYLNIANTQITRTINQIEEIKKNYSYLTLNSLKDLKIIIGEHPLWYNTTGGGDIELTDHKEINLKLTESNNNYQNLLSKLETATKMLNDFKQLFNIYLKNSMDMLESNLYVSYHIIYVLTIINEVSSGKFHVDKSFSYESFNTSNANIYKVNLPYLNATINRMKNFGEQLESFFIKKGKDKLIVLSYEKKSFIDLLTFIHLASLIS